MTNTEIDILQSLLVKYVQEAEKNGFISTIDNSKPGKPDVILEAVKKAECFICAFMPGNKEG